MAKKALTLVAGDGEEPAGTVSDAAESGNHRALLVALRARIASDLDDPKIPAHAIAPLARRLLDIAKDIEAIDASDEGDDIGKAAKLPDKEWSAS